MLYDAHNNGYFLLRIPSMQRNAIEMLRNEFCKQDGATIQNRGEERLLREQDDSFEQNEGDTSNTASEDAESFTSCCEAPSGAIRRMRISES